MKLYKIGIFTFVLLWVFGAFSIYSINIEKIKGQSANKPQLPEWLESLENGDEAPVRKKFELNNSDFIVFCTATDKDLDIAKETAHKNAIDKVSAENSVQKLNNFERLYEYWIQLDGKNQLQYKVYLIYVLRK